MFESLRGEFGFSYYGERRTSASVDIPLVVVVYICILISIATIVAAAGIRGKARWYTLIRVVYSLAVGSTIILCLFGDCWVDGIDKKVSVPYIYRSDAEISGVVGLNIGLQKINITLKGTYENGKGSVKYNEAIQFNGAVGAIGDFRTYLERGLPQPVLTVVEFFTIDEAGFRWGRSYAVAGYIAKILLLTSFAFWILANIMICSVIFYGAVLFTLTGLLMFTTSIVYHFLLPTTKLRFFCSESEFHLYYGICFWSTMLMGLLATVVGLVILFMETKMPKSIQKFFLIEGYDEDDEAYETQKNSLASNSSLYKKNDFRRQSAPSLIINNNSYNDLHKPGTLYSVAEDVSQSATPQMRRSATNPGNLQSSYSMESLRAFSEQNDFKQLSKNDKHYRSNPFFQQKEHTDAVDPFTRKIPSRMQTAMSLESLQSVLDTKDPQTDSGVDNDENEQIQMAEHHVLNTIHSESDGNDDNTDDNSDNFDVSMFDMPTTSRKNDIKQKTKKVTNNENDKSDKVFTITVEKAIDEDPLKEVFVELSSAYP